MGETKPPEEFRRVSKGQFSIARHYGRIKFQGHGYTYLPESDTLVRDDVLEARRRKAPDPDEDPTGLSAKAERAKWTALALDPAAVALLAASAAPRRRRR